MLDIDSRPGQSVRNSLVQESGFGFGFYYVKYVSSDTGLNASKDEANYPAI